MPSVTVVPEGFASFVVEPSGSLAAVLDGFDMIDELLYPILAVALVSFK